ncbi:helix-turn-helix domain-containing protein [Anaerotignum faecicola]
MPKRKIYMAVTKDALSLPLAVADSVAELAELRGVKKETIRSLVSRGRTGKIKRPGYIVVEVEEDAPRKEDMPRKEDVPRKEDAPQEKKEIRRSRQSGEFDREIFRERIRLLRKESGMTKKDFAAFTGIAYITLYNYERKDIVPGADMLFRIAVKTGCSVDWLIGLKEEKEG